MKVTVKARFSSSRAFAVPETPMNTLEIDEFRIAPLPSDEEEQEAILNYDFRRRYNDQTPYAQIELAQCGMGEPRMWLAFLALVGASNVRLHGVSVNGELTSARRLRYLFSNQPPIDFSMIEGYYDKLGQLSQKDRLRFVNSARAYQSAVSLMDSNPAVSFFLLVVAIECLSNYVMGHVRGEKNRHRFIRFIETYLPPTLSKEKDDLAKFRNRLETAYKIRSSYVHSGQSLPPVVYLADKLGRPSVLYEERRKEWRAPGLLWLQKVVRATLLSFLDARTLEKPRKIRKPVFRNLARSEAVMRMRLKEGSSVTKYQPIGSGMLRLD